MVGETEAFLWGLVGGAAAGASGVLPYWKIVREKWPRYLTQRTYWVIAAILAPVGGVLALLLVGERDVNAYLAFHTGLAAPLVLERLAGSAPDFGPGKAS